VSWLLPHATQPVKVTIINKGSIGGYTQKTPLKQWHTYESHYRDRICGLLGGRAAEELVLGMASTGAVSDLERASFAAAEIVTELGYGKRTGLLAVVRPMSETTMRIMEEEMVAILTTEYARAKPIIAKHRSKFSELVEVLLQKEVIHEADIEAILGPKVLSL
jgi:ATP-dependent Zn protease